MNRRVLGRFLSVVVLALFVFLAQGWGRTHHARKTSKKTTATAINAPAKRSASASSKKAVAKTASARRRGSRRHRYSGQTWSTSPIADSTADDDGSADDPIVRSAAVNALGPLNGSIVVVDPNSGRILTMVNQKVALGRGYTPCSTIKMPVTLAGLQEGVLDPAEPVRLGRRWSLTLTDALAHSNNQFFERVGAKLGWEKLSKYERDFGFGELAGYNIEGETLGTYPAEPPKTGVAHMSSFGEPISVTPLQMAAFVSAVANGGTLYYLQYPRTETDKETFQPRVKRHLNISAYLQPLREGMMAAVEHGTARRLEDPYGQVLGKTGTCSEGGTRLGWFASYENVAKPKLVVVVLLRGGRYTAGPRAAEIAGRVYSNLHQTNYYAQVEQKPVQEKRNGAPTSPATAIFEPILK